MGRYVAVLIIVIFGASSLKGQKADATPGPNPSPAGSSESPPLLHPAPPFSNDKPNLRERFNKMSEEDRQRFMENFHRWQQMSEEEKQHFRERAMMENDKIQAAIKEAIKKTGLSLDQDRQEIFALRYIQERRKIEKALRQEMEIKRNQQLEQVVDKLKAEFKSYAKNAKGDDSHPNNPTSTPQLAASPSR